MFLAAAVPAEPRQLVLDIGCGSGAATLCLAARVPQCRVIGLELQRDLARLAADNAALNDMAARVTIIAGDLLRPPSRLDPGMFDHVMANPPFIARGRGTPAPDPAKAAATIEGEAELADWVRFALTMVRPKGSITFVHRADRLDALLGLLAGRAGEIAVFPLWPAAGRAASRILVRGESRWRRRPGCCPGWCLHEADGRFTPAAEACCARARGSIVSAGLAGLSRRLVRVCIPHSRCHELPRHLELPIERFRHPPPIVTVVASTGSSGRVQSRDGLSLASHAAAIEKAFAPAGLGAVALAINSPGGSPVQSALLFRRIRQLAEEKRVPVFAFAEDVPPRAAIGWRCAADEIYRRGASLLGSIGVVTAGFGFDLLIERLGIERRLHTAGERKSLLDPFLPENPRDVARLTRCSTTSTTASRSMSAARRAGKIDPADESLFSGEV